MAGQRLQPQVVGAQFEAAGQLHRAHHRVDRQFRPDHFGFGGQERVVEAHVVGDEGAAAQQIPEVADDVAETRLPFEHVGSQTVHMGGPGIDAGVEQAVEAALDVAVVAEGQCCDADDPSLPGAESGRLHVDDGPACAGFGCRPAPGLAHKRQDGTVLTDIAGSLGCVSST